MKTSIEVQNTNRNRIHQAIASILWCGDTGTTRKMIFFLLFNFWLQETIVTQKWRKNLFKMNFFFKKTQKIEFLITNTALFVIVTWYSSSPSTNFKFWKGFNVLYSSFLYVHKRCRFPHCDGIKSLVDYLLESMFLFWSVINLSTKFQRAFERRGKKTHPIHLQLLLQKNRQSTEHEEHTKDHSPFHVIVDDDSRFILFKLLHYKYYVKCIWCISFFFSFLRQVISVFLSSILTFFSVLPTFFIINRFTFVISVISIAANV